MSPTLTTALSNTARDHIAKWSADGATPLWCELVDAYVVVLGLTGSLTEKAKAVGDQIGYHYSMPLEWLRGASVPPVRKAFVLARLMGFPPELVRRSLVAAESARAAG